jgi:hypothetical protein
MGILARIIRFVWRRWADYNSFVAILDLFDWKTGFFSFVGFWAMIVFGATNDSWSPQGIVLAALIAAACVSLIVIAFRFLVIGRPINRPDKSVAEITAIITMLEKAHAEAVTLVALPDSDSRRNRRATWTMDTLRMMKQLDMPKHEIFVFQNPAGLPDQDKCLRERQQLLRSLVEKYMRERRK